MNRVVVKMNPENIQTNSYLKFKTWTAEAVVSDRVISIESKRKIFVAHHRTSKCKCCKDKDEKIIQADLYWFGQTTIYIKSPTFS